MDKQDILNRYKVEDGHVIAEIPIEFSTEENVERLEHELVADSTKCKHVFIRQTETEAVCERCRLGLFINPTDIVKDGEIKHVA